MRRKLWKVCRTHSGTRELVVWRRRKLKRRDQRIIMRKGFILIVHCLFQSPVVEATIELLVDLANINPVHGFFNFYLHIVTMNALLPAEVISQRGGRWSASTCDLEKVVSEANATNEGGV